MRTANKWSSCSAGITPPLFADLCHLMAPPSFSVTGYRDVPCFPHDSKSISKVSMPPSKLGLAELHRIEFRGEV
ncbi:hypothetical protein BOTBODRAFT_411775 [Botryobasidium botryosum FD-172 SS1]|uniref:Uncharacterized protein n=1 Tax=Botryobasidium botryosum (strain FD-172 SS1) TaxID=930990 RepID=A0A067MKY2_BOTB1|nr:hypothetical protein BOTBODRAFT_411775 [Botryobasidium botryosum FD-172 SS1]